MRECERIIASIEHFYGHMEIECCDSLGLCSVEYKEDLDCSFSNQFYHLSLTLSEIFVRYNKPLTLSGYKIL